MQILLRSFLPYYLEQRVLLEKPTGSQLGKKFPALRETRWSITTFSRARQLSLSWARLIQSMHLHPTSRRYILLLSIHLRLDLPSRLLPSGLPSKTLYAPLLSPICGACPARLILHDSISRIIFVEYRSVSSSDVGWIHLSHCRDW